MELATTTTRIAYDSPHVDERAVEAASWPEIVGLVRRTMRRIVGPCRDLDDLTQVALEQVVRGLPRFEGRSELSTFVYRVAANVAMNHWRWWRRWLRRFELGLDPTDEAQGGVAPGPDAAFEASELALHVRALLDRLDAQKRIVLVLAEIEELPASRIAAILECPEPTVRSRLRLARAKLAEIAANDPYFGEELRS